MNKVKKKPVKKNVTPAKENKKVFHEKISEQKLYISLAIIFLVTLISFFPSFKNAFVGWDDEGYLHENISYLSDISSQGIKNIFSNFIMANYHPLTILVYAVQYNMFELNPFPYHLTNVILHLLNTILVFWFIYKLSGKYLPALITALLFGIHPLHVESVSWISETKDVLYGFFFIISLILYLKYRENKKLSIYALSVAMFILSCLSKGMAVTLPMVLILIDYYYEKKFSLKQIYNKIVFFAIALIFGIVAIKSQVSGEGIYNISAYNTIDKITFPFYALLIYLYKMFLPINLAIIYSYPLKETGSIPIEYFLSPIIFIALCAIVYIYGRKNYKLVFGTLFYLFTIAIVIQILPVGINIASERYFYISSIVELFINKCPSLKNIGFGIGILVLLILAYLSFERTKVWENSLTLWSDLLDKHPNIANIDKAYYGIANHYYKTENIKDPAIIKSRQDSAIKYFKGAIFKNPNNEKALNNLGNAYYQRQQYDSAYIYYNKLVTIKPNYTLGLQNMGNYYYVKGQFDTAIEYYNRILKIDPNYALSYYTLGLVFQSKSLTNTNIANRYNSMGDVKKANELNILAQVDMKTANDYFQKAAQLGNQEAIKMLSNK